MLLKSTPFSLNFSINPIIFLSDRKIRVNYNRKCKKIILKLSGNIKVYIFGPALVNGYELESKKAIYPRIIIDSKVIENGIKYRQDHHSQEELYYVMKILTEDDDKN